jgi:hypothetical protein
MVIKRGKFKIDVPIYDVTVIIDTSDDKKGLSKWFDSSGVESVMGEKEKVNGCCINTGTGWLFYIYE